MRGWAPGALGREESHTLGLLTFLSAHLADAHVLVVATCRDDDVIDAPELQAMLAGVARERHLLEVALRGLDQESTAKLIQARVGSVHVSEEASARCSKCDRVAIRFSLKS
jgi:hypothetical protein